MALTDVFTALNCSRCKEELEGGRTMSWFTQETICMSCAGKEDVIKRKLRAKGIADAMEGCGYVPEIKD